MDAVGIYCGARVRARGAEWMGKVDSCGSGALQFNVAGDDKTICFLRTIGRIADGVRVQVRRGRRARHRNGGRSSADR